MFCPQQYRSGRSATSIARIQKISRQMVYKLVAKHKKEGSEAYKAKKAGKPTNDFKLLIYFFVVFTTLFNLIISLLTMGVKKYILFSRSQDLVSHNI